MNGGVDNHVVQLQPLKSRENAYEYKDQPAKFLKSDSDLNSIRSPSSLAGMTQITKIESQSSLRSAVAPSLKESSSFPNEKEVPYEKSQKYAEREIDIKSDRSDKSDNRSLMSSATTNTSSLKRDFLTSSPVQRTPTPTTRSTKSIRTVLDAGIPQTEV